jgi:prepilin-type N-terminal cleavage/methylation domain-containing protein
MLKLWRRFVDPGAVSGALRDRLRAQHGFTLIEVLVSALLVLIISAGVATALVSANDYTGSERGNSQANAVAQQDQERLKSMSDSQLTSLRQTRTVPLNGTQFTVLSTATYLDASGNSSCSSGANAYFKLTSKVTSPATAGNPAQSITEETVITRPLAGTLLVKVGDQTGTPLSGAAIAIAGQNTGYNASATTDTNGCVAFAGLPTDGYAITASDPGYVDPNGDPTPTQAASVNQTTVANPPSFVMGPAGAVRVGFMTKGTSVTYGGPSGTGPAPSGYELSYYGAGNGSNMSANACLVYLAACAATGNPAINFSASTAVSTFLASNLFPFYLGTTSQYNNNYQMWGGACEQEQPLQPPAGTGFASITPGRAASATPDVYVDEPAIDVALKYSGSFRPVSDVTITFTGKDANGVTNCVDVWHHVTPVASETVSGTSYNIYPAPFASTAAKGSTSPMASNTGDAGSIVVCADYNVSGSTYYQASSSSAGLTNTNFASPTMVPVLNATTPGRCP